MKQRVDTTDGQPPQTAAHGVSAREYAKRVAIAVAFAAIAFLLWKLSHVLILGFGGMLFGTLILAGAAPLSRGRHVSHRLAVACVIVAIAILLVALGWFFGSRIAEQIQQLSQLLPSAWSKAQQWLQTLPGGKAAVREIAGLIQHFTSVSRISGIAWSVLGALGSVVLVIFVGLFFAWNPSLYRTGALRLAPPAARERAERGLRAAGTSMRLWSLGQLISMLAVAILTGAGLLALGVPLAFSLALIAGLFEFVPLLGPFIGAVPGILIGFTVDARTALYVALMYLAIQQIESYVVTPLAQRWAVSLPPALALLAVVGFAALFGIPGLFFAVPMTVAAIALVRTLYIEPMEAHSNGLR